MRYLAPPPRWKRSRLRRALWVVAVAATVGIALAAAFAMAAFAIAWRDLPSPEDFAARRVVESTKIYDRTGTVLLYDIHGEEKRTVVAPDAIADAVRKATIAVEDANFYNHIGVEPKAILRAVYYNIMRRSLRQGASTITQQLIGNTITDRREKTIVRKVKDAILAIELERKYEKDEILAFYLNQIPYGANAYGVEAAAQTYFGKPARDLSLAQAATLAALPKAPTYYSPYGSHKDALLTRKDFVLARMRTVGFITEAEETAAKAEALEFVPTRQEIRAPHFVFHVREQLEELYGERYLEEGGLRIITSLDWDLQEKAQTLVHDYALANEKQYKAENAALAAVEPKTGDILALVGSRDYFDENIDGNVNVATRLRQPGSSFKPFAYATAFAKGYTPDTMLFDLETNFGVEGAKAYIPQNYDGEFRGPVSMRRALAQSLNVPAVKTLYLAGVEDTIKTAEAMGITSLKDRQRFGLSLVLGGGEVTLLEETAAYGAFAADGIYRTPRAILRIEDVEGKVLREYPVEERKALEAQTARLVTDVLSDNAARAPVFGEKSSLWLGENIPAAAKTGTTQENKDAWVVGYTTGIAAGVWSGNNDATAMSRKGAGLSASGPLWHDFMVAAAKTYAATPFPAPDRAPAGKPVLDGSLGEEVVVRIDRVSGKRATAFTPPQFVEEQRFLTVHDILHFVAKDDPRGPVPSDPTQDSQYWGWEHPVEQWVLEMNAVSGSRFNTLPPQEFDDVHREEGMPSIALRTPVEGERIMNRTLLLAADVTPGERPVTRVEFYVGGLYAGSRFGAPYVVSYTFPQVVRSERQPLTAKVVDDWGREALDTHEVVIDSLSGITIEPGESTDPTPSASPSDLLSPTSVRWPTTSPGAFFTPTPTPTPAPQDGMFAPWLR